MCSAAFMQTAAAEEQEQEGEEVPEATRTDVADLRELLPKRSEPSTGLFSAAAAGLPEFIAIGEEEEEDDGAGPDGEGAPVPYEPAPADEEEAAAA